MEQVNKAKNYKIQMIRAIAAIAVIGIHTTPDKTTEFLARPFLNFAVATFIFLSGYLTKIENNNWKEFFKKRITRVLVPYIVWTVIYSVVTSNISKIPENLLTTKASGVLYYIFIYIKLMLLTPLLGKLLKSKYSWGGWLITPISILVMVYIPLIFKIELNQIMTDLIFTSVLRWITFYYLGLALGNRIIKKEYNLKKLIILYVISIILQFLEEYIMLKQNIESYSAQLKFTSIITSVIVILIFYCFIKNRQTRISASPSLLDDNIHFNISKHPFPRL